MIAFLVLILISCLVLALLGVPILKEIKSYLKTGKELSRLKKDKKLESKKTSVR